MASWRPAQLVTIGRWIWPQIMPTIWLCPASAPSSSQTQGSVGSVVIQSMPVSIGGWCSTITVGFAGSSASRARTHSARVAQKAPPWRPSSSVSSTMKRSGP
jgi:hypothetical protein